MQSFSALPPALISEHPISSITHIRRAEEGGPTCERRETPPPLADERVSRESANGNNPLLGSHGIN